MGRETERRFLVALPFYVLLLAMVFASVFFPLFSPIGELWSSVVSGSGLTNIAPEWIGALMIAIMLFAIFVGFPLSFTLVFLGFAFGAWGFGGQAGVLPADPAVQQCDARTDAGGGPLFVFMGILMEQAD